MASIQEIWAGKEAVECSICLDGDSTYLHSTCGVAYCEKCIRSMSKCAFCSATIKPDEILPILTLSKQEQKDPKWESLEVEESDDELDSDPIIQSAIEKGRHVRAALSQAINEHNTLPENKRPCCSGETRIYIKDYEGKTHSIQVDVSVKVGSLKRCLSFSVGVCPDQLRVIRKGKPLDDDNMTLAEKKVKMNDTLHLILNMRGS